MLYVNPLPPVADAVILPLLLPAVGFVVVVLTETVTPEQGLLGGGLPPPLQAIKPIRPVRDKKMIINFTDEILISSLRFE
jgi:hypothetical protein